MTAPAARFPFAARTRAVLFDAGNTLLWLDHERMAAVISSAGIVCTEAAVRAAEMHARPRLDPWLRDAARRESHETRGRYAALVVEELERSRDARGSAGAPGEALAAAALVGVWGELWNRPPADAATTLDALAARGFAVGCVSNSSGNVASLLETAGLAARLGCIVDSGVVGVEKPDPRIFRIASERLGVEPARCVYVGDFLSLDVEGARGAGMEGVLLDPAGAWAAAGVTEPPRIGSLGELLLRL